MVKRFLLIALIGLWPAQAMADCAMQFLGTFLATPRDAVLPNSATLLVQVQSTWKRSPNRDPNHFGPPPLDFHLERDGEIIKLAVEPIAPGLMRLVPERAPTSGVWEVRGLHIDASVTFSDESALPARPNAPVVTALEHTTGPMRRRGILQITTATLASAPPQDVVFLAAHWTDTSGSYGAVTADAVTAKIYTSPNSCQVAPDGQVGPPIANNDGLELFFVDRYGQVSDAASSPAPTFPVSE